MLLDHQFFLNKKNKNFKKIKANKFRLLSYLFVRIVIANKFLFFLTNILAFLTAYVNYNVSLNVKENIETPNISEKTTNEGIEEKIFQEDQINNNIDKDIIIIRNNIEKLSKDYKEKGKWKKNSTFKSFVENHYKNQKDETIIYKKKMNFVWDFIFFISRRQLKWEKFIFYTVLFLIFVKGSLSFLHWYINAYSYDKIEKDLKVELFRLLTNSIYGKSFEVSERMLTQFSSDLDNISRGIWSIPNRLVYVFFSILFNLSGNTFRGKKSSSFTLIILLLFLTLLIFNFLLLKKSIKVGIESKERYEEDNRYIFERINNLEYIKSNSGEKFEQIRLLERLDNTFEKNKISLIWNSIFKSFPIYLIIPNIPFVFMLIVTILYKNSTDPNLINLLTFVNIVDYFFVVRRVNNEANKITEAVANLDDLSTDYLRAINNNLKLEERENEKYSFEKGDIVFDNISFNYPSRPNISVINNLSFIFENGKMYGISGKNGMGKSTITKILLKLYDISGGNVFIGNKNIYDIWTPNIHRNICHLTNKPSFFGSSISYNVFYPFLSEFESKSYSEKSKMLENAARKTEIWEFIKSLPQGFDTILSSNGSDLSEGQKQQIEAMKVFLRSNYKICIFDEMLSNVHPETRGIIIKNIIDEVRGKLVITIDHQYDIFKYMDYVYNFSNGGKLVKINNIEKDLNNE